MNKNIKEGLLSLKSVIRTKDFGKAKAFYNEILQLNVVEEYDDGDGSRGCIMGFSLSGAFIEISEIKSTHSYYQSAFSRSMDNDKVDIQIKTEDVDFWAKRLSRLWEIRGPVERPWGSRYLYLKDPDGLQIIIYQEKNK